MANKSLIAAAEFCTWHQVDYTFISSLHDAGLITIEIVDKKPYVQEVELNKLEKMTRLYNDLEINLAGIEAITHLLERVENMQEELRILRNRQLPGW